MSIEIDSRPSVNDGSLDFAEHIELNRAGLEAFFRSMLKPINDNEKDIDKRKNIIVKENFSFEPLKRLYFQDFYRSLLSTGKLHDLITMNNYNHQFEGITVIGNTVKDIQGATGNDTLDNAIKTAMGELDAVEIDESHFHSTIEFSEANRHRGLYDTGKLLTVNNDGYFFELGLMETIFKEEEEMLKADIAKEKGIVSLQTIARRLVELFARLSNVRLSMLFWTDKVNDYAKAYSVAALDIFYNLMSRMSEAHRLNIPREWGSAESHSSTTTIPPKTQTVKDTRPLNVLFWIDSSPSMQDTIPKLIDPLKELITTVRSKTSDCMIGIAEGAFWLGEGLNLVCNFTNNPSLLGVTLDTLNANIKLGGRSEGVSGLMNIMWGPIRYASDCKFAYLNGSGNAKCDDKKNDSSVRLNWKEGAKRVVIVVSDEPMDNYTCLCNCAGRKWKRTTSTAAGTLPKYDNTTYTYYCLPKNSNGTWKTYKPSDHPGSYNKRFQPISGESKVAFSEYPFLPSKSNGKYQWTHIETGDSWTAPKGANKKDARFTVTSGWQFDNMEGGDSRKEIPWKNTKNTYSKPSWAHALTNGEFTMQDFVNSFINPEIDYSSTPSQAKIDASKDLVTELHWVAIKSYRGTDAIPDPDGGGNHPNAISSQEQGFYEFLEMLDYNIIRPVKEGNNGNGRIVVIKEPRTNDPDKDSTKMAKDLKEKLLDIFNNRTYTRTITIPGSSVTTTWETVPASLKTIAEHFARAARLNKVYADMTRPCVFVPNLVSTMMMISTSKAIKDGVAPSGASAPSWSSLVEKVCGNQGNPNFSWFGRTNQPRKDGSGNVILLKSGMYGNIDETQNDALNWGGDYAESLTGIHLKLIDKPIGSGWSTDTEWSNDEIWKALNEGMEILADAFTECINDAETMKVLDMSTSPPTPKNFPELLFSSGGREQGHNAGIVNVGDLQYSLLLERIIAKVYEALNVKSSSFFKAAVPKLNVDFALRLLTDLTLQQKNELTNFRTTYSTIPEYVERVNAIISTNPTDPNYNKKYIDSFDLDSQYILNKVVTKGADAHYAVNDSFKHMLQEWSLCPYRYNSLAVGEGSASISETAIGGSNGDKHYNVKYQDAPYLCPFAETVTPTPGEPQNDPPCDRPHGCRLRYEYTLNTEAEKTAWVNNLKAIPAVCPSRALVNSLMNKHEIDAQVERLTPPSATDSEQYIHALFKSVDATAGKLNDDRTEESRSMGFSSSYKITTRVYPQDFEPVYDGTKKVDVPPSSYKDEEHSNVRLIYLEQLVRLCQDMFRFNMNLAFDEPYLKTKVTKAATHYYGNGTYGSFEPVTCYRFTNFHALNDQDTRGLGEGRYQLKYFARKPNIVQYVTAINRDLSGETSRSDGIWTRETGDLKLDNERQVPGQGKWESELCYPYHFSYENAGSPSGNEKDGHAYMLTKEEIISGVIDPAKTRSMSICRSVNNAYPFYHIHLMDELADPTHYGITDGNQKTSLATFEVYVKRFRPIYLPNAEDLFKSEDRDPLKPSDPGRSAIPTGWAIVPHKYSADVHFSKNAIIIPTNFGSRNSPRSGWFNELDYAFHRAIISNGTTVLSGFYTEDEIWNGSTKVAEKDSVIDGEHILKLVGRELYDLCKYHYRDWMYPASLIAHCYATGDNGALLSIPQSVTNIISQDTDPSDGANDYVQGSKGNIVIYKQNEQPKLSVTGTNLKYLDLLKCIDTGVKQDTALNANWLYITTPSPGSGVETSQCMFPLPWVFFHSSRGDIGAGPSNWYHGLGNRVTTDHETSFQDWQPQGMRFFAVNAVLAQNPIKMKLFGRDDIEVDAKANIFGKGFYDPSCAGTDETWHIHGSDYYGWPNGSSNKDGPRPDKYYLQYDSNERNHVTGGTSLTSSVAKGQYYSYKTSSVKNSPFASKNETIIKTLIGKPCTWSLWNVLRQSIWLCYNKTDPDYDPNREGCTVDRSTLGASDDEIEYKTEKSMRAMYKEWYQRFTYNGKYTSNAGIDANTAWPYKASEDDPTNYGQAQKLLKGQGEAIDGSLCCIEWTNLVADVSIIYNEVSDTHDSCMTMYTGGHPNYNSDPSTSDTASGEFLGSEPAGSSGVSSKTPPQSWGGSANTYPNASNSKPFRYALDGVDMCRNFMALTYRGYNSSVPDRAINKYQAHSTHPKALQVSREIKTIRYVNPDTGAVSIAERSTCTDNGTEMNALDVLLKDIYPPAEEDDTEGCDMNYLQRLLIPCYPNWEDLHTGSGNSAVPIPPDAASVDDLKKIVFCVAPITYYHGLASGNGSNKKDKKKKKSVDVSVEPDEEVNDIEDTEKMDARGKKKKNSSPAQMGERMMAFCIAQFYTGEEAEKITSTLDTEFFAKVAAPNVCCIADDLGHDYKPGDPPWGQAMATAENWDPNHWRRLA